jgi:hypothetical protein
MYVRIYSLIFILSSKQFKFLLCYHLCLLEKSKCINVCNKVNQYENKISVTKMRLLRWMCGKTRWDSVWTIQCNTDKRKVRGRPRKTIRKTIIKDLKINELDQNIVYEYYSIICFDLRSLPHGVSQKTEYSWMRWLSASIHCPNYSIKIYWSHRDNGTVASYDFLVNNLFARK